MTYLLAISLTTTLCLLWLLHSERSSDDRRTLIDGYNDRLDRQEQRFLSERSRWASERRELNQRIQAPQQAVAVYAAPDLPPLEEPESEPREYGPLGALS